ncbi:MAG: LON peptidase substrate-binding domain-containing protein [Planctomycetes bacterium]|nr:LON peptidase substrate-binding domain-containing protein [Planctomycetota bacterium]
MSESWPDLTFSPEEFSGRVRLFPLPNLVMFPHVIQPLHIFEPRYRQMLEEALADDRMLAMALLAPGWERDYEGRPAVHPMACLGRVATHQRLEDGRYNLLLFGLRRVELIRELGPDKPYRIAEARLCEDQYPTAAAAERDELRRELLKLFRTALPSLPQAQEPLDELLGSDVSLGALTDIVGYTLQLDLAFKQRLLSEPNVDRRARLLLSAIADQPTAFACSRGAKFPPEFSEN